MKTRSIAYSPSSQTEFNALVQLASQGLIKHTRRCRQFDCGAQQCPGSVPRLSGHGASGRGTICKFAMVSEGRH